MLIQKVIYDKDGANIINIECEVEGGLILLPSHNKNKAVEMDVVYEIVKNHKITVGDYNMSIPRVESVVVYTDDTDLALSWKEDLKEEFESRNRMILEKACQIIMLGE